MRPAEYDGPADWEEIMERGRRAKIVAGIDPVPFPAITDISAAREAAASLALDGETWVVDGPADPWELEGVAAVPNSKGRLPSPVVRDPLIDLP